ncbi:MAG TPA: class I SAM-dependent methyltransferase [Acidobacteriaceae bacterium]|jgi:ubiquinone/menaquinone biosynthesis C-methylase UbiE
MTQATHPDHRPADFDPVARIYRWAEYLALGSALQRTRTFFLPQITDQRSAFVLGDGDGRFLAVLLAAQPQLHATAVDTSASMLALLQQRCAFAGDRVRTVQASALGATAPPGTDLIVTHFLLDCLNQSDVDQFIENLATTVAPGTLWLASDFQIPERRALRPFAWVYIRLLYLAFRLLTGLRTRRLPDTRSTFRRAGFERIAYHERLGGLVYSELWKR